MNAAITSTRTAPAIWRPAAVTTAAVETPPAPDTVSFSAEAAAPAAVATPAPAAAATPAIGTYPARIIIIRHGEKPDDDTDTGLTAQGQARAQALAPILHQRYPNISYIFASAPSKHSDRPVLTITPTAQLLGLPINQDYRDKDYASLAHDLLTDPQYAGQTIAICWHHGEIPALAQALGVTPPENPWPSDSFDRIWQIDYSPSGQATVQNLPQNALPGDSTN